MRVAIFQGPAEPGDVPGRLELLAARAEQAAAQGAGLLVCPEMYLTGYAIGAEAARRLAEPADGSSAAAAAAIARKTGTALLYGFPEAADGRVYNAASLLDRQGQRLLTYRKSHLFGDLDRGMFSAGDQVLRPVELEGLRVGVLICYDVEFPENVRRWALAGADLVAVPTALMQPYDFVARSLVPARAYENQVFVAYANRCDREHDLAYIGLSCLVAPDGSDLARAGRGEELIAGDIDVAGMAGSRRLNTYLADRRPELYEPLVERKEEGKP
jgi:predicted amidohydrolase